MPMVAPARRPTGVSRFGAARVDDDGQPTIHRGVDLYAPMGTAVTSPGAGTVMWATNGYVEGFARLGRVVVVALDSGGELLAGHLKRATVSEGERVKRGQRIGTVGDTLYSRDNPTGRFKKSPPHVHVELLKGAHYPVPRGTTRQDPTALAFYGSEPEAAPLPRPVPKPVASEVFASVQDAQTRADALLGRWNALASQATGPSAPGRSDVPRHLQTAILNDRARFRTFITRPTFGLWGAIAPQSLGKVLRSDYHTLKLWYAKQAKRAAQLARALPSGETLASGAGPVSLPRQRTATENLETATLGAQAGLIALALATVLGLAAAAFAAKGRVG